MSRLEAAFAHIGRAEFVPPRMRHLADRDEPLPIGSGQTISQPYTVKFMLELLDVREGHVVFEIGYGSGWQSALLAYLVGERGKVHACERLPELCKFGQDNVKKFPALEPRVTFYCRSASNGIPSMSFDRIIAAASVEVVPSAWREQLKTGGILVYPSGHSIWQERKFSPSEFEKREFPGFIFVPYKP